VVLVFVINEEFDQQKAENMPIEKNELFQKIELAKID
jgi:hypothetical protein